MENKTPEIFTSLQAVNDDLNGIKKDQQGFNYKFRGIDQVMNTIGPLFKKHGIIVRRQNVTLTLETVDREVRGKPAKTNHTLLQADYVFVSTKDGSELSSTGFGEGEDKGDKGVSCATSNSYKYVIFEMFNIPSEDLLDSDMKTAKENGVTEAKLPEKKVVQNKTIEQTEVKKPASFRNKKVAQPTGEL